MLYRSDLKIGTRLNAYGGGRGVMKSSLYKKAMEPLEYLFWKTQISVLHHCPPLLGAITTLSMGGDNSRRIWFKMLRRFAAQAPRAVFFHLRDKCKQRVVLGRLSIFATLRCTLNCDKCSVYTPDIKHKKDFPLCEMLHDIQALLACVDYMYAVTIAGGEAFLNPDLDQILRFLHDSGKVGSICIYSNGTVVPGAAVFAELARTKSVVQISKYPCTLQPNVEQLKATLNERGIPYTHESGTVWRDLGAVDQQQLQIGSAKRHFGVCVLPLCSLYLDGKLHLCSKSAIWLREGLIPDCKEDYIDIRTTNPDAFRGQLQKLFKRRSVSICSHCLGQSYKAPKISVAVQRESRNCSMKEEA